MGDTKDIAILRELATEYAALAADPIQEERRRLWRDHNSLIRTRPLVLVMLAAEAWREIPEVQCRCEDRFYRGYEASLRRAIVQQSFGDDTIAEPWITVGAALVSPPEGPWGLPQNRIPTTRDGGAWKYDPPLKSLADLSGLVAARHVIDEAATRERVERLREAVGDILPINLTRAPYYRGWRADISTDIAYLRGLEQLMWDMADDAEGLHRLLAFMRDGILANQEAAEKEGDWSLSDHNNQAMSYARELPDPKANSGPVTRDKLWVFMASQELTLVSPAMHEEFMLRYQMPIMAKFGLSAYGCCEDLTEKIDMLRQVPNLRRIGVTPRADVARSAEQIREDYVFSWRPNPAEMMCCGFDADHIRRVIRDAMDASRGCHVDLTLKDVQTLENDPTRPREWVRIVREITDQY